MITVWRGIANQWDCDEMGHMNVRIYVEKAMEGLAVLAAEIDMPHAFRANTPSTLIPADQHIRFMREALPGRPLTMTALVLEVGESDAVIYQEMKHGDGSTAAAFRTRVIHAEAGSGKPFPWSSRSRVALEHLIETPPDTTAPRSVDPNGPYRPLTDATVEEADRIGVPTIGMGAVQPVHCDLNGRMRPEYFIGRISDSVPNLLHGWRQSIAEAAGDGIRMGAAVLEYRLIYRRWPRAGDRFEVRTSLGETGEKVHSLVHWVMDPETGLPWVTSEAVAVTFDLDKRKVIPTPKPQMAELAELAPPGLSI